MKVCGFSFVKSALKYDYSVVEAITSILPVCDKFIVAIGCCDDCTRELIESIDSDKIEIIDSVCDPSTCRKGHILTSEINKTFDTIPAEYDWCFYIQRDEVMHEKYLPGIVLSMRKYLNVKNVDGMIMPFTHFYGTFDYYADSRRWNNSKIRIVRNNKEIRSSNDARGFRWKNAKRLTGIHIDAKMYHYGWVRSPELLLKNLNGAKDYCLVRSKHIRTTGQKSEAFKFEEVTESLKRFRGAHPKVMQPRIDALNWHPELSTKKKKFNVRYFVCGYFEKLFNQRTFRNKQLIEYKES